MTLTLFLTRGGTDRNDPMSIVNNAMIIKPVYEINKSAMAVGVSFKIDSKSITFVSPIVLNMFLTTSGIVLEIEIKKKIETIIPTK